MNTDYVGDVQRFKVQVFIQPLHHWKNAIQRQFLNGIIPDINTVFFFS